MSYYADFNMSLGKCPACGGGRKYPMIVTVENGWRSICGDYFHDRWLKRLWFKLKYGTDTFILQTAYEYQPAGWRRRQ